MTTTASPSEVALILLVLGVPFGLVPLGASLLAARRPARTLLAAVVTGLAALAGLLFPWGGVFTLVGAAMAASCALWLASLRWPRKALRVAATCASALPLLYAASVAVAWS